MMRVLLAGWLICAAAMSNPVCSQEYQQQLATVRSKAVEYLKTRGQTKEGAFSPRVGIGVTALAATALMRNGVPASDPAVSKALALVVAAAKPDGGIYAENSRLVMYETCVAITCLQTADPAKYKPQIDRAAAFVRGQQFDEGEGKLPSDVDYGGAGYGGKSRPDLSNTAFMVETLQGLKSDENNEAINRALIFISRCQNLESPYNISAEAAKINDGGFYYTVSEGGASPAGETSDGGLRSYGSMTYAGFKSMIYAGLKPDDPRVKAARQWIETNYSVKENPGMGDAGLYYYYSLFAKALHVSGAEKLKDAQGQEHNWRSDLVTHLASLQTADGSFSNKNTKWMEGDPNLATTFALLALSYCD